jgi:uncharacterized Zn-binding protein involved in type VI secretion
MLSVARMNDIAVGVCTCHKTPISTIGYIMPKCSNVLINGLPAARQMDIVQAVCGHIGYIVSASPTITAQGIPMARVGDLVTGCFIGNIVQGSSNVLCS